MLYRVSLVFLLACSAAASAANPTHVGIHTDNKASASNRSDTQVAYRNELNGFTVDKNGGVHLSTFDNRPALSVTANGISEFQVAKNYAYDTSAGIKRISLIDREDQSSQSAVKSNRLPFTAQNIYGQTAWVSASSGVPEGWGVISGNFLSYRLQIICLYGAPYGSQQRLNSDMGIPFDWVRAVPGAGAGGTGYSTFMYVGFAPPAAEIWADSYFPIPINWVRVSTGGAGFGRYRNTTGVPSGTVWTVDISWGVPSDWSDVGSGYPMRRVRKN